MAIQAHRTQSSIYLTLKVLQFVNELRRRLKPRLQGSDCPSCLGKEECLGLRAKVPVRSITKELSRIGIRDGRHTYHASDRVCKRGNNQKGKPRLKLQTPGRDDSAIRNSVGGEVQHMLNAVDEKLSPPGSALSAIAGNNTLFLKQKSAMSFEGCSLNETIQLFIQVYDAARLISVARTMYGDAWLVAQAQEAGFNINEVFLANYEHLLMRLRADLIEALARKVFEAYLLGDHDKKQRRLLSWFAEFAGEPLAGPVCSSFPWTIKPSLAVLWGVCWMYYDRVPSNRQRDAGNNLRVRRDMVLQQLCGWTPPAATDYLNFGLELAGIQTQPEAQQQLSPGGAGMGLSSGLRSRNTAPQVPTDLEFSAGQNTSRASAMFAPQQGLGLNTYRPQYIPGLQPNNRHINYLPADSGNATALTVFPQQLDLNSWQQLASSPLPQRPRSHLTNNIPDLRVTDSTDNEGLAAPPDFAYRNIYTQSTQEPQASALNVFNDFTDFSSPYAAMGNCAPPDTSSMQRLGHERTSSVNSNTNIPTPVSMSGPQSPLPSPAPDRRFSVASPHAHHRERSVDSSSQDGDDADSPHKTTAFKRLEEPPRNGDNKMVCKYKECASLTFDRKCEWSKHMDKHDRPYKCNVKGCEKLQGFTYSGGLLRHEREVHKMHGGTKKSLFCPFADCKRSSGAGFTRKENLAEHIRRVHRRTSLSMDLGTLVIPRPDSQDGSLPDHRLTSESPYQRMIDTVPEDESQVAMKRKRDSEGAVSEMRDEPDLRAEIKRLRRENEEKDARLQQLEQAVMALQDARR